MTFKPRFHRLLPIMMTSTLFFTGGCEHHSPTPIRAVAFLDASASSMSLRPKMKAFLEDFVGRLDRQRDKLIVYRLADRVSIIYSGEAWRGPALRDTLDSYIKESPAKGTSLGAAFDLAVEEASYAQQDHRVPVVMMIGDAADEPGPGVQNLDLTKVPDLAHRFSENTILTFVYANPTQHFDQVFHAFQSGFGANYDERLQFSTIESEDRHQVRNFLVRQLRR